MAFGRGDGEALVSYLVETTMDAVEFKGIDERINKNGR